MLCFCFLFFSHYNDCYFYYFWYCNTFFLLTLEFFISSYSSCFRCKVKLFIWFFSWIQSTINSISYTTYLDDFHVTNSNSQFSVLFFDIIAAYTTPFSLSPGNIVKLVSRIAYYFAFLSVSLTIASQLFIIFIFTLFYNTVLVLPYIDMNPPWVYMHSQTWTPLPPPSP